EPIEPTNRHIRRRQSDLSHADDVAVRVLEERAPWSFRSLDHTFHLNAPFPELGDLGLDVIDLESGHGSTDRGHWPLEDRQARPPATSIPDGFRDCDLDLETDLVLVEATSPLHVGHGQGGGYARAGKHRLLPTVG